VGLLSTAGAAATNAQRTLGHNIGLALTGTLMLLVNYFMYSTLEMRSWMTTGKKYGPLMLTGAAFFLVLADPLRHVLGDQGVWQWCGNNAQFPRINETWGDQCLWSSTEYKCTVPCCVPEGGPGTVPGKEYPQLPGVTTCECGCVPSDGETMANLSTVGWLLTFGCT